MPLWRGGPNTRTWPAVLLTLPLSKAADMAVSLKTKLWGSAEDCSWHPSMRHSRERGTSKRNIESRRKRRIPNLGLTIERWPRGWNSSLVVFGLAVQSVAGSILLWGNFPVERIFPLELTWVQTPFEKKTSFRWEHKPRSSLCTHACYCTDSKDPDVHVLDGWMPATKTHPARTIHEDGMWLP